jgi:prepilin-type N-terminal cleavage/methylation domain-containing protein
MRNFNHRRSYAGFTMAEVVVVSLIVGILAAVAVPVYVGYVHSSKRKGARQTCELVAAAVTFNHNRGLDIRANTWTDIDIANPQDDDWIYGFDAIGPTDKMTGTYKITVTGTSTGSFAGQTGFFYPRGDPQWSEPSGAN